MRKIVLEEYKYEVKEGERSKEFKTTDKEILQAPLDSVNLGGRVPVTYSDLKQIDGICEKIKKADKELLLEEDEYRYLKQKFEAHSTWTTMPTLRKLIIATGEKLMNAEIVEVKEDEKSDKPDEKPPK